MQATVTSTGHLFPDVQRREGLTPAELLEFLDMLIANPLTLQVRFGREEK